MEDFCSRSTKLSRHDVDLLDNQVVSDSHGFDSHIGQVEEGSSLTYYG